MSKRKLAGWLVHLYTALGGVIGMAALFAAVEGHVERAFLLLILTMLIDSTDGILARMARVHDTIPDFDGGMMDNVIDVLTFVWVPVFIMWNEQLLPHPAWVAVPILAALYAYGQVGMKTEDHFFLGFPSYWNVVALYLYWIRPAPAPAVLLVVVPAILTFVPTRYLYASRNQVLWRTTWSLGAIWIPLVIVMLSQDKPSSLLIVLSLFYPAYYMIASFYIDWQIRRRERLRKRKARV